MQRPRLCATITDCDSGPVQVAGPLVDFFEVRLDLVGPRWPEVARSLNKPWIACNRSPSEGGRASGDEKQRLAELLRAVEAGAWAADIELQCSALAAWVPLIKARSRCLVSYHNFQETPSLEFLAGIVSRQMAAGADICKVVTLARRFSDNLVLLDLIRHFPGTGIVAFAMGEEGKISRILSPLAGGYFTYASISSGKESAAGQVPIREMAALYGFLRDGSEA